MELLRVIAGCYAYLMKNKEIEDRIDESIHNELHRRILKRRMIDGLTYEKLAEEFNYSVRQMKRIIYKAQDNLIIK